MKNTIKKLKKSPLFNLSLSSKELFHSNFLYWLAQNYPKQIGALFLKVIEKETTSSDNLEVFREKENIDLSFHYSNGQEIIIENKVKSLPYLSQLQKYSKKPNAKKSYVLLSLSEPVFFNGKKELQIDDTLWHYLSYGELRKELSSLSKKLKNGYHKYILRDYINFIKCLIYIDKEINVLNEKFDFHSVENLHHKLLKEIRLTDFYLKKKYELFAFRVYKEIKKENSDVLEFNHPLDWKCDKQEIFIGYNMTRGMGLMDVKYKLLKNLVLGIQIQGDHYRMFVEDKNSKDDTLCENAKKLLDDRSWFLFDESLPNGTVYPKKDKVFNTFSKTFFYKYIKLGTKIDMSKLIEIIVKDFKKIKKIQMK